MPQVEKRWPATEKPGHLVLSRADLAVGGVDSAPAKTFRDRTAKKELLTSLRSVLDDMTAALDGKEQFSDYGRLAALLPRVEAALARLNQTMVPGPDKDMAVSNVTELRDELRDFAAALDGGTAK